MAIASYPASAEPTEAVSDETPNTCDWRTVHRHMAAGKADVGRAFEPAADRHLRQTKAWQPHKFCLERKHDRTRIAEYVDEHQELERRREQRARFRARYTPFYCPGHGWFAVECYIVGRESGFDKRAENPGSTAGGWYQIIDSTWFAFGGSETGCYHVAACASGREQHKVASRVRGDGSQHWAATR